MQINSINTSFSAKIPTTKAAKELSSILDLAKNYDYSQCTDYEGLCKNINKLLPKDTDEVIFNGCDSQYGSSYYISGEIKHNKDNRPFSSHIYYRDGSNVAVKDILSSIKNALKE